MNSEESKKKPEEVPKNIKKALSEGVSLNDNFDQYFSKQVTCKFKGCFKVYKDLDLLKEHSELAHRVNLPKVGHTCLLCKHGEETKVKRIRPVEPKGFKKHIRNYHTVGELQRRCPLCTKRYRDSATRKRVVRLRKFIRTSGNRLENIFEKAPQK